MLKEFKTFIARGNVIDMAVGIVVGAAFTAIVTSLVSDIINPLIGMAIGGIDFSQYYIDMSLGNYASLEAAKNAGAPLLMYGLFINAVIKFLIVAFVVFLLVKQINRLKAAPPASKDAPPPPEDIQLLREIRDALKSQNKSAKAKTVAKLSRALMVKSKPVRAKAPATKKAKAKAKAKPVKKAKARPVKKAKAKKSAAVQKRAVKTKATAKKKAVKKKSAKK